MVKPTIEDIQHSDLTPLERELALASFGAEALTVAQMEESLAALESAISDAHSAGQSRDETHDDANGNASGAHPAAAPASRESAAAQKRAPDPALASNPHLQAWRNRLNGLRERNQIARPLRACGRLTRAAGLVLEA